jgi:tetratricopeptide (TPR) repeat protein
MLKGLTFYPWKLVWPAWLSPYYPLRQGFAPRMPPVFAAAVCVGIVTALSIWARKHVPALTAGWAAYVALVLPVSGLMQTGGQAVADRYAYEAVLPLLLLAGGASVWAWRHCGTIARPLLVCLLLCETGYFGVRTRAQIPVWHDDETLWNAVLAQFPKSHLATGMLGRTFLDEDRIPEAIEYWQRTVELAPGSVSAHNNLGIALSKSGSLEKAVAEYQQAVAIDPGNVEAQYNLAVALGQLGRIPDAIRQYEQVLQIDPDLPDAHFGLGVALERTGNVREAIRHYQEALRIDPNYPDARNRLARLQAIQ